MTFQIALRAIPYRICRGKAHDDDNHGAIKALHPAISWRQLWKYY